MKMKLLAIIIRDNCVASCSISKISLIFKFKLVHLMFTFIKPSYAAPTYSYVTNVFRIQPRILPYVSVCTRISYSQALVCYSYVLVSVTRMYPYVTRGYSYVTRLYCMFLVCTRMLFVCYSYVLRIYSYVTCMYSCGVLSYDPEFGHFLLLCCRRRRRNVTRTIKHVIVLLIKCFVCGRCRCRRLGDLHKLEKKKATSAENISAMKRLLKLKTCKRTFRLSCPRGIPRVTSSEEICTMSKNKLIEITFSMRPKWGTHSLNLIISDFNNTISVRVTNTSHFVLLR